MQKTLIYIDLRTKAQVRPTGALATTVDQITVERGQWQILCIQFVDRVVTSTGAVGLIPAKLTDGASLVLLGDNNFDDDDSLMFKSFQSSVAFDETDPETNRFNIEGDWIGGHMENGTWIEDDSIIADPEQGQYSIRINADTTKFVTALDNKEKIVDGLYINIKQYITGLANPSTVAWFKFTASNTIRDWSGATEEVPQGTTIVPFIDGALRNPMELQFSADKQSWHDTQTIYDTYYRFRIANTSVTWSDPVEVKNGKDAPEVLIQYSSDGNTWQDHASDDNAYIRFSTDEGIYWGDALEVRSGEDAPIVMIQYSSDGLTWQNYSDSSSNYIRFSNDEGASWSSSMRVVGRDGTAAGFGNVTASATTIDSTSSAAASVTTSGTNALKNFEFNFNIPQGVPGKTPVRGVDYYTSDDVAALLEELKPRLAKVIINDTTSTAPVIDTMVTNALYTYSQPLTSLTINNVPMSTLETDFSFTAGEGFQLYTPADVYPEMGLEFNAGGVYTINIYAKRLVAGEFSSGE